MANIIRIKRGLKENLPTLLVGELAFCTDTNELFVGKSTGNVLVNDLSDLENYFTKAEIEDLAGTGLSWNSGTEKFDIDNPFNPSGTFAGLRAQATTAADVGLGNVTNESKATMFSSPTFTGTVTGVTKAHVGLGNVTNDAQVKKTASSTSGNIPTWNGTTGDALNNGYGVETTLTGGTGNLPRADAVKAYVDGLLAANDAMIFKGTLGSGGTYTALPTTHNVGWTIKVITAGTYAGKVAEIGDMYVSLVSRSGSGNTNADWAVIQANIDGAVVGPASSTNNALAVFDGTTGKLIKNSSFVPTTIGSSLINLSNPSAITFPRFNANNTVSSLSAADFRTAIGAGTSSTVGTVTSVGGTGTVSGLTLTGTVTASGNLTLGGTLSVTGANFGSQTANRFLGAPDGSNGNPTFRALVAADIPNLDTAKITTGTFADARIPNLNTSKLTAGLLAFARGGTARSDGRSTGVIETRAGNSLQFWQGTQAQYNAIGTKNANTIYFVAE